MAIRRALQQLQKTGVPSEVHLSARAAIGATGAVSSTHGRYVTFARSSEGVYTATVDNTGGLIDYLYAEACLVNETNVVNVNVTDVDTATGVFTITVTDPNDTDAVIDPTSGASLCFRVVVVNSTVNY